MSAVAGVLDEAIPLRNGLYAMSEEPAQVPHLFRELWTTAKPVRFTREHQGVSASHARVLVNAAAFTDRSIRVMAKKAGQCMPDVGEGSIFREICLAAPASPLFTARPAEKLVVDCMAPQRASQSCEPHTP